MSTVVDITLPGPPVEYAVDPARLVTWLESRGYAVNPDGSGPLWSHYRRGAWSVDVPLHAEYSDYPRCIRDAILCAARNEQVEPHTLAALLAGPAPGPALQWAHASADTRAAALADIDALARQHRREAARLRDFGAGEEQALDAEGRAMGLEAAAAVLRGGGR